MTSMVKYATALTLAAALAAMATTPSQARNRDNGTARDNNGNYSAQSYAYDPAPGYQGPRYFYNGNSNSNLNERLCTLSPGSIDYVPCENAP